MFRITKTLFRPEKTVAYSAVLDTDQKTISARLAAAKKASPGFISSSVHRTSSTTKVHIESWDSKESHDAFLAANLADITYSKSINLEYRKTAGLKISKFSETI